METSDTTQLIRRIHDSPSRVVLAMAGGGSRAAAQLLETPGASRTVLEIVVPYGEAAMIDWLGGRPDSFCAEATARAMAVVAMTRAGRLEPDRPPLGLACTASLASDRPKRGPHRVHVALQSRSTTATRSLELSKGSRTRDEEERLASRLVLNMLAEACGVEEQLPLDLLEGETVLTDQIVAPRAWQDLMAGRVDAVCHRSPVTGEDETPKVVFPGAFHPIHHGHRRMARIAAEELGSPVAFELSVINADKPPLDYLEIRRRLDRFAEDETVWLTGTPTFAAKTGLFPGATFVVGIDTLRRIAEPRFYGNHSAGLCEAVAMIAAAGCRFLVFGRATGDGFEELADLDDLPETLRALCRGIGGGQFRADVSSTEIRREEGSSAGRLGSDQMRNQNPNADQQQHAAAGRFGHASPAAADATAEGDADGAEQCGDQPDHHAGDPDRNAQQGHA